MIHAIIKVGSTDKGTSPAPAPKKEKDEKKGRK